MIAPLTGSVMWVFFTFYKIATYVFLLASGKRYNTQMDMLCIVYKFDQII